MIGWGRLRKAFFTGLIVLLPLLITVWVLYLFANQLDAFFQPFVAPVLGRRVPGLGFILGILLILVVGTLTPYYIGRKFQAFLDQTMMRVPVIRGIYSTTRQIIDTVRFAKTPSFRQVVLVEYPRRGVYMLGFVTRPLHETASEPPAEPREGATQLQFVFIPTTPNPTSGFLIAVPDRDLIPLNISPEDGIKLVVSAGLIQPVRLSEIYQRIAGKTLDVVSGPPT